VNQRAPSKYGTQVIKPDDFDIFWGELLERSDKIPLNASLTLDSMRSTEQVEVFEVHYDSLNSLRVFGWYCLPRFRPRPLPARVFYPGYISEPTLPKAHAEQGMLPSGPLHEAN